MYGARDNFLADASLAANQHSRRGRRNQFHGLKGLTHRGALRDDLWLVQQHLFLVSPDGAPMLLTMRINLHGRVRIRRLANQHSLFIAVLVAGLVLRAIGVGVDADLATPVPYGNPLAQVDLCKAEVTRGDTTEHTRGHTAQPGHLLYDLAERAARIDDPHDTALARSTRKIAADLILD